jgi:hypothetical protein
MKQSEIMLLKRRYLQLSKLKVLKSQMIFNLEYHLITAYYYFQSIKKNGRIMLLKILSNILKIIKRYFFKSMKISNLRILNLNLKKLIKSMGHILLDLIRETIYYGFTIMSEEESTLKMIKFYFQNLSISLKIKLFFIQISINLI